MSALAWSHDGRTLAAGSLAGDAVVYHDARALDCHVRDGGVLALGWSRDGVLAIGGENGRLQLRDVDRVHAEIELGAWINAMAWSPKGRALAVAAGREVVVVDAAATEMGRDRQQATISSLAWSVDARRIGVGSYGGVAWYAPPTIAACRRFDWKGSILTLAMSPNGKWLASGNQDNSVHVWRLWTGEDMQMSGYRAKIEHIAWDPTSRWLCVGDIGEITCWDFAGRGPQGSRPKSLQGHERRITALEFHGQRLASGSADGTLRIWAPPSTRPQAVIDMGGEVSAISWHRSGRALAVATGSGALTIVDAPS